MSSKNKRFFNPEEQVLAIKISFIVLFGLFLCFFFLISLNGLYLRISEKIKFSEDIDTFQDIAKTQNTIDFSFFNQSDSILAAETKSLINRLSEDIIIVRQDGKVYKNGFFEHMFIEQELLKTSQSGIYSKKVQEREFFIYKFEIQWNIIFFTHEITDIQKFQNILTINSLLLSLLFFLVIYIISVKLAQITLKPIQDNNERLKEYNHYVAHELKTPLAVLRTNIELSGISDQKELSESSKEEISSMENIIDWLLFLSESSIKKENLKIDLNDFIQSIIRKKYKNSHIEVQTSDTPVFIFADSFLFERMVRNLLENALKYSTPKTPILLIIDKKRFTIQNTTFQEIAPKNLQKLFEPFYQWDTSHATKGYWLWLSIVKRICDIFWWKISLEKKWKVFSVIINF